MNAQAEARAFIAGMEHVAHCSGCPVCLVEPSSPKESPKNAEEQTLTESVSKDRG